MGALVEARRLTSSHDDSSEVGSKSLKADVMVESMELWMAKDAYG